MFPQWDEICGDWFKQSRSDFEHATITGLDEFVKENHHTLLSPELTDVKRLDTSDNEHWNIWAFTQALKRGGDDGILHNRNKQKRLAFLRDRPVSEVNIGPSRVS